MKRILGALALVASASAHAQALIGVQLNGSVIRIDPTTGTGGFVGPTGFNPVESAAYLNGRYYAVAVGAGQLIEINQTTGAGVLTGIGVPAGAHALTHGPSGTLYAVQDSAPFDKLLKLQPNNTWAVVGTNTGFADVVALACSPNGTMYAWDTVAGLLTINTTGVATDVGAAPGSNAILSICAPSNTLILGGRNQLYAIDPGTGVPAVIGGGGGYVDVNGLAAEPTECLAVSWPGNTYHIDYLNGSGTSLGPSGYVNLNSMAYWRDRWYTSTSVGMGELISLSPTTGAGLGTAYITGDLRGMSEGPGGNLYGIAPGAPCLLKVFDPSTGSWNTIGPTGAFSSIQALAYHAPSGKFYAWDTVEGALTIDPLTAATADVNPGLPANVSIQSLDFGPDGFLYGCNNVLFTINLPTGVAGPIGGGGFTDVRGIGFGKRLFELPISTFAVGPGSVFSGTPADATSSDNAYWQFRPGAVLVITQSPLVVTVTSASPGINPSTMRLNFETRGTTANISEKVEMLNYRTGAYDLIYSAALPTSDTSHQVNLVRPGEYCGPGNVVTTRFSYKPTGGVLVYPWRVMFDKLNWEYLP